MQAGTPSVGRREGKSRPRGRGHRSGRQGAGGSEEKRTSSGGGGGDGGARESFSRSDKPRRKAGGGGGGGGGSSNGNNRSNDRSRSSRSTNAQARKLLIRNIPHTVEREQIEALLEAHGAPASLVWRFIAGHVRQNNRPPRATRVYLDLKNASKPELGKQLITELTGYSFSKDDTSMAKKSGIVVEFAPYQKIPRDKPRRDTKMGTIERDPEYLEFLEALAKVASAPPERSMESLNELVETPEEKPVAALVQFLNERKASARDKGKGKYGKGGGERKSERSARSGRQGRKKDGKDKKKKRKDELVDEDKKTKSSPMRTSRRSTNAAAQRESSSSQSKQVRIMSSRDEATASQETGEANKANKPQRRRDHQRSRGGGGGASGGTTSSGGGGGAGATGGGTAGGNSSRRSFKEKDGSRGGRNRESGSRKKVFAPKASTPASS